jgi:cohesin loading factor subunit SCC2
LGRSLFCLGLLLRYGYDLMASCDASIEISKILGLLKRFLLMEDFSLKVRALQVCCFFFLVCSVIFFLCSMVTMSDDNSCKVNY